LHKPIGLSRAHVRESENHAYSLARTTAHWGQNAYLYLFAYAEKGKHTKLGAYHGEELYFLSNSYPTDWEHDSDDERLGQVIRAYWVRFAKTGNPNLNGLPEWPAYEPRKDQYLELWRSDELRQVPERVKVLGRIMEEVVADATGSSAGPLVRIRRACRSRARARLRAR
jgi:carboxylesterase type B